MQRIEEIILHSLITNHEYSRKVLPFIKEEYFSEGGEEHLLFVTIRDYIIKYGALPSKSALYVEIDNIVNINESTFKELKKLIESISGNDFSDHDGDWLIDNTEKFCQDRALYNGIMDAMMVVEAEKKDKSHKNLSKTAIPLILSEALSVSFDNRIGHNFLEDYNERYDYYHQKLQKVSFDIDLLNDITGGGLPPKSLSVILGGTGVGKSLVMCHMASNNLIDGKNVLYITLEMSEEETARRIDANLLDVDITRINDISSSVYESQIQALRSKTTGKLIIKQYPTASGHTGHFRHLLDELKMKEKFKADIIYIDYINICASSRIKMGGNVNSYSYIKSIAEEIRGLGVEFNVPIVTATQVNRTGFGNSDVDLDGVSESFGLPATADLMFAIVSNEQLAELGQYMVKQLKNRYNDVNTNKKFVIGVDKSRMRLYNLEGSAQNGIVGGNVTPSPSFNHGQSGSNKYGNLIV